MRLPAAVLAALAVATAAHGQNIDISTAPPRSSTQLTIYNSADLTLVRETRTMTLQRGRNALQFSWSGTLIDPTSVMLRFPSDQERVDVIDATFPHQRPQVLEWTVQSELDGAVEAEITYFTSGVSWAADYVATVTRDDARLTLEGHVRITNASGASFDDAEVRLVVGEINLVETVRELAQRGFLSASAMTDFDRNGGVNRAWSDDARERLYVFAETRMRPSTSTGVPSAPPAIIKEGLSEYFIFTVEGTQAVPDGWSRRLRLFDATDVENDIRFRYRPEEYGEQLARLFIVRNDAAHDLGTTPLPDGAIRVFRVNAGDTLSLVATTMTKYVPIGQEIEIVLGADPLVRLERVLESATRDDFWFRRGDNGTLIDAAGAERLSVSLTVGGWVDRASWLERVVNDRDEVVHVEIRRRLPGDVTLETDAPVRLHDYQSPEFAFEAAGQTRHDVAYTTASRKGILHQQDRVEIRPH